MSTNTDRFIDETANSFLGLVRFAGPTAAACGLVSATVAMCVQHPEWAAAWYQEFKRDGAPVDTPALQEFVRKLPISTVTEVPRGQRTAEEWPI